MLNQTTAADTSAFAGETTPTSAPTPLATLVPRSF
uniref:Uncharacterized protein n=1 Tax=Arundo donax TaxID=35708 RepID=A0A0A9AZU6_ARUDO